MVNTNMLISKGLQEQKTTMHEPRENNTQKKAILGQLQMVYKKTKPLQIRIRLF